MFNAIEGDKESEKQEIHLVSKYMEFLKLQEQAVTKFERTYYSALEPGDDEGAAKRLIGQMQILTLMSGIIEEGG